MQDPLAGGDFVGGVADDAVLGRGRREPFVVFADAQDRHGSGRVAGKHFRERGVELGALTLLHPCREPTQARDQIERRDLVADQQARVPV